MRKRRERKRGKHSPDNQASKSEDLGATEADLEPSESEEAPDVAQADTEPSGQGSSTRQVEAEQPEETPPVEAILSGSPSVSKASAADETTAGQGNGPVQDERPDPVPSPAKHEPLTAGPPQSASGGDDLDALGRMLEQSLGGKSPPPPPSVSVGEFVLDTGPASVPPQVNATPEDILGVPTQHAAIQEMNAAARDEATESQPAQNLGGTGTGTAPMEAFEQRAQMAKEVLRASSNQSVPAGTRPPKSADGDPSDPQEPAQPDELEEDVRFSEDLTISVKRRRKLFGR